MGTLTQEEERERLQFAKIRTRMDGWKHIKGWIFKAPSGTTHDLSCANLEMLEKIEREQLFVRIIL